MEFKVGDRVKYTGNYTPNLIGRVGTITGDDCAGIGVHITWDNYKDLIPDRVIIPESLTLIEKEKEKKMSNKLTLTRKEALAKAIDKWEQLYKLAQNNASINDIKVALDQTCYLCSYVHENMSDKVGIITNDDCDKLCPLSRDFCRSHNDIALTCVPLYYRIDNTLRKDNVVPINLIHEMLEQIKSLSNTWVEQEEKHVALVTVKASIDIDVPVDYIKDGVILNATNAKVKQDAIDWAKTHVLQQSPGFKFDVTRIDWDYDSNNKHDILDEKE